MDVLLVMLMMVVTLAVGVGVLFIVASPYVRRGDRVLTPKGDELARQAAQQIRSAREKALDVASSATARAQSSIADLRERRTVSVANSATDNPRTPQQTR